MTPSAFIFLYENQLFLTFRHRNVAVWNFRGECLSSPCSALALRLRAAVVLELTRWVSRRKGDDV
eukprot:3456350-Rhodomonas_salina.3